MTKGSRNLIVLGVTSVLVALTTTGVSLALYHNSGDIYLDRSRPGFLPDKDEVEQDSDKESGYEFPKNTVIDKNVLNEYSDNLKEEIKALEEYSDPFDQKALSDERFGI